MVENEITDTGAVAFAEYLSITTTLTEMRYIKFLLSLMSKKKKLYEREREFEEGGNFKEGRGEIERLSEH